MDIKKRLVVAFLILLIVPVLIISAAGAAVVKYQKKTMETVRPEDLDDEALYYLDEGSETEEPKVTIPFFRTLMAIGLVIVCTAAILVVWLYGSIIRPLNVLSAATHSMERGELDFTISGNPDDEIGRLCLDFETMRVRLKETIDARLKYENDTIELISNISHDLKTPLTAIKGYAEGIMDGVADTDEKRNKYLRTIYNKAVDMQVLVDELSFYSKIDSDIVPYNFKKLGVNDYFNDCVLDQSLDMEVKGVSLTYESGVSDDLCISADPEQLKRVVGNIIGNSVKYMDKPEGRITITSSKEDRDVVIRIADNGSGIAPEDLPHIFERFYRADSSRGSRKGGSGLGLAIAVKIIEDHGGHISAESTPGEGTQIIFTLPGFTGESGEVYCEDIEDAEFTAVGGRKRRGHNRKNRANAADERGGKDTHGQNTDC